MHLIESNIWGIILEYHGEMLSGNLTGKVMNVSDKQN